MDFSAALHELKSGNRVARAGWNGKRMSLALVEPGVGTAPVTAPFIAMTAADASVVPWVTSQADVLAEDWTVTSIS